MREKREALRKDMMQKRTCLSSICRYRAARVFAGKMVKRYPLIASVALYMPYGYELDVTLYMRWCWRRGVRVYVPQLLRGALSQNMRFVRYRPGARLVRGRFSILQPEGLGVDLVDASPDVVVVPCVALDANRYRLGSGKGFYDRALKYLRGKRVMYAGYKQTTVSTCWPHDEDIQADEVMVV